MGLNWQHCNHCVFFPTWSYEQMYQAYRRFWRFGQKNNVTVDLVISDGQTRVIEALKQKTEKAKELYRNLVDNVNGSFNKRQKNLIKKLNYQNLYNMTKEQLITEDYAIYNSDCMEVIKDMPDESVDLSVYSPPFASLYTYSSSERDMSNVSSIDEFVNQYEFLVKEMSRVTKKGRINAIHITDICDVSGTLDDFPNRVIELYKKHGFEYKNRVTVWKEPLKVRIRTMVQSLMHKHIVEDSTKCFTANPDYILVFKKKGENEVPVTNPCGLNHYAGEIPILPNMLRAYNNANNTKLDADKMWDTHEVNK